MIGTVALKDLHIECIIGVLPEERDTPQTLFVDVEMDLEFETAAETDDVANTIDYAEVAERLTRLAVERKFQLIETFAEEAATALFDSYEPLRRVRLHVKKPAAVPAANHASVHIKRWRPKPKRSLGFNV